MQISTSLPLLSLSKFEKVIFYPVLMISTLLNIAMWMGIGGSSIYFQTVVVLETISLIVLWFQFVDIFQRLTLLRVSLWFLASGLLIRGVLLPFSMIA